MHQTFRFYYYLYIYDVNIIIRSECIQVPINETLTLNYIATQAPTNHTCEDFWHLLWQSGTQLVVMLTELKVNEDI
jgi:protein tyrosine phosphatase